MDYRGTIHLNLVFKANQADVAEGDDLFASHNNWMAKTHHRDGDKALLAYNVSKGDDLFNSLDPSSSPTGKTVYVLDEIYESSAGIADHWQQAMSNWEDFNAFMAWAQKCEIFAQHSGKVINSLW